MKRRTVMVLTTILALLLATIPANAATLKGENTLKSGESVESNVFLHTNLEDVINTLPEGYHDNFDGTQNQFFCRADGWAADPDDRSLDLNVKIFSDGIEIAQTVADTFRQDLADAGVCFMEHAVSVLIYGI